MNTNPFDPIQEKLEKIEMLLKEHIANQSLSVQKKDAEELPMVGGIELAMKITGLKKSTIYKLTSQNKIPYKKPGGKLIFLLDDLFSWIKNTNITG